MSITELGSRLRIVDCKSYRESGERNTENGREGKRGREGRVRREGRPRGLREEREPERGWSRVPVYTILRIEAITCGGMDQHA